MGKGIPPEQAEGQKPQPEAEPSTKVKVEIEYDMATDKITIKSGAPTVMLFGILGMANSIVTQNQTLGRLQAMQAKSRLLKPGDRGFNGGTKPR